MTNQRQIDDYWQAYWGERFKSENEGYKATIAQQQVRIEALESELAIKRAAIGLFENAAKAERERAEDYKRHTERLDKEYRDVLAELQAEREKSARLEREK